MKKYPIEPTEPRKPYKPIEPEETLFIKEVIFSLPIDEYINVKDLIEKIENINVKIENSFVMAERDYYDDFFVFKVVCDKEIKNKDFKQQMRKYNTALKRYEKRMEKYNNEMKIYKEKMKEYRKLKKEYDISLKKNHFEQIKEEYLKLKKEFNDES